MKTKRIVTVLAALALCVGAFFIPEANAVSGLYETAQPPTVRAWIDGDLLCVETAGGQYGIEAVYIGDARVNYRVDGAFDVPLRDYAGNEAWISIYAVDFAGRRSDTVWISNPYYVPPATTASPSPTPTPSPTPIPVMPMPTPKPATPTPQSATPALIPKPAAPVDTAPILEPTVAPPPSPAPVPADPQPFTPAGTGTVLDNANESDGKEFFTVVTEEENTFYLIVDRQRNDENVYLLNSVTESDLMALAEKDASGPTLSAIPTPEPAPEPTPAPTPVPEEPKEPEKEGGGAGTVVFILIAALAAGAIGYYFKIHKPRQEAASSDDEDEDNEDDDDEDGSNEREDGYGKGSGESDMDAGVYNDSEDDGITDAEYMPDYLPPGFSSGDEK